MDNTAYILTFDRDDVTDYKNIHSQIIELPSVITWWHYIKSSYIIIASTSNASKLNKEIMTVIPNTRCLLIEINLKNRNGRLPPKAWDWLKNQESKMS